jgi:hypothetical protein
MPKKKDTIRVVGGADDVKGKTGQLLSFAGDDAITKLGGSEIKVLPSSLIGLVYSPEQPPAAT